jgi:hypothetical protein
VATRERVGSLYKVRVDRLGIQRIREIARKNGKKAGDQRRKSRKKRDAPVLEHRPAPRKSERIFANACEKAWKSRLRALRRGSLR